MDQDAAKAFSKGLSGLLRHNQGGALSFDAQGFAEVDAVVDAMNATKRPGNLGVRFDAAALAETVANDAKGRFQVTEDGRRVRAVSGHTFEVDLALEPFRPEGPLWFGTVVDKAAKIAAEGMTGSRKLKVRLSDSLEGATAIAEARGCGGPAVFEVDALRMAADGFTFGRTTNGEILVGHFGPQYLSLLEPAHAPGPP